MPNQELNFIFWGTPDVASNTLEILKEGGFLPSLIITMPDRPSGRKMLLTPPPVKVWAIENNIPYLQPDKLDSPFINKLKAISYKLSIVVAYGKIISQEIIDLPKFGSINIHYSLLPKYRGASPVESAILNGDKETGVTIQKMAFKLDAGDILAQESIDILGDETTPELRKRLIELGSALLIKLIPNIVEGKIEPIPQDESQATFCGKMEKEDGLIDLSGDANKNYNKLRAYVIWPRTYFLENGNKNGKRNIITKARLENGKFVVERIIPENGKEKNYTSA